MIHFQLFYLLLCFTGSTLIASSVLINKKSKIDIRFKIVFCYFWILSLIYLVHSYIYNYINVYYSNSGALLHLTFYSMIFILPWFSHSLTNQPFKNMWNLLFLLLGITLYTLKLTTQLTWITYILVIPFIYIILTGFIWPQNQHKKVSMFFFACLPFIILDLFKTGYLSTVNNPLVIKPLEFFPIISLCFGIFILKIDFKDSTILIKDRELLNSQFLIWSLSEREKEVLSHILEGKANRDIAADLFITESTIKKHINSIFKKSGCNNRWQIIRECSLK